MLSMNNLYTQVRAVNIPTIQIKQIEDEYGVKLVPDTQPELLLALDAVLLRYMLTHNNKLPDAVQLMENQEYLYRPMVLNMNFMGMEIPGSYRKPSWWQFKKNHFIKTKNTYV